jgi:hypothetical protein
MPEIIHAKGKKNPLSGINKCEIIHLAFIPKAESR